MNTFMPLVTGVARRRGNGFGAFSTCTRHIRQLAAIDGQVVAEMRNVNPTCCAAPITMLPSGTCAFCRRSRFPSMSLPRGKFFRICRLEGFVQA